MSMKLYSVHDSKAGFYLPPQMYRNAGEATRAFENACKQTDTNFNKYPKDFTLLEIGTFDQDTGVIDRLKSPLILCSATEFIQ